MERGDPALLGRLPLWLKQGLPSVASSSPPLADSLRGSLHVHRDSCAAPQEVPYVGEMGWGVREGDGGSLVSSMACQLTMNRELTIHGYSLWEVSPALGGVQRRVDGWPWFRGMFVSPADGGRAVLHPGTGEGPASHSTSLGLLIKIMAGNCFLMRRSDGLGTHGTL